MFGQKTEAKIKIKFEMMQSRLTQIQPAETRHEMWALWQNNQAEDTMNSNIL